MTIQENNNTEFVPCALLFNWTGFYQHRVTGRSVLVSRKDLPLKGNCQREQEGSSYLSNSDQLLFPLSLPPNKKPHAEVDQTQT